MAGATGHGVPNSLVTFLLPFRDAFTAPTWEHVLVLVMGAILVPGLRTVASPLRVMGLGQAPPFTPYHRVLNRNAWSAPALSRRLLIRLVDAFVPVITHVPRAGPARPGGGCARSHGSIPVALGSGM